MGLLAARDLEPWSSGSHYWKSDHHRTTSFPQTSVVHKTRAHLCFPSVPSMPLSVRHYSCHRFMEKETKVRKVR